MGETKVLSDASKGVYQHIHGNRRLRHHPAVSLVAPVARHDRKFFEAWGVVADQRQRGLHMAEPVPCRA